MIKVGRFINGISLNPYEWLLKSNGKDIRRFRSIQTAKKFLKRHKYTEENMEFMKFEKI